MWWSSTDFLATKPFTFYLGADAKPMVVQGGLFKDISEPLHARIPQTEDDKSGTWQRDSEIIDDVEWDVFAGLVEFAYTGDYDRSIPTASMAVSCPEDCSVLDEASTALVKMENEPAPEPVSFPVEALALEEPAIEVLALEEPAVDASVPEESATRLENNWGDWPSTAKKDKIKGASKKSALSELLWKQFVKQKPSIAEKQWIEDNTPSSPNAAALLYHAKVCVLANRYLIDSLQRLSLTKLHFTLTNLSIEPQQIDSVLDLVEYVYSEEGVQGIPELKEIVLLFTTAKLNVLQKDPRLRLMLEANGTLGADVIHEISAKRNWR
ncbi:MAG: hypothetical protein GOMPHAMPRED_001293 [Gomphillus americanus]|uniref:BTB domain-containing protein n=1 Tax=Gomphillus americanus TaxID=1940652 RepID=A0A8H3I788_9LECA|nr:MAG: hypothetical protein GOMPHAMPRED_001293 [Gomphillus americanus]